MARVGLENQFPRTVEMHLLSRDSFDRGRIALERLHVFLQFSVLVVKLVDFHADFSGFLLRAAHRQHAVRPEDVLEQQQRESGGKKPIEIAVKEFAHLLDEGFPLVHLRRLHCLLTHACASSASFCDAAGEPDSV
jgi:hypothetical protein